MSGWCSCNNDACLGSSLFHILCQVGVRVVMMPSLVVFQLNADYNNLQSLFLVLCSFRVVGLNVPSMTVMLVVLVVC